MRVNWGAVQSPPMIHTNLRSNSWRASISVLHDIILAPRRSTGDLPAPAATAGPAGRARSRPPKPAYSRLRRHHPCTSVYHFRHKDSGRFQNRRAGTARFSLRGSMCISCGFPGSYTQMPLLWVGSLARGRHGQYIQDIQALPIFRHEPLVRTRACGKMTTIESCIR